MDTQTTDTTATQPTAIPVSCSTKLPFGFLETLQGLLAGIQTLPDGFAQPADNGTYTKPDMIAEMEGVLALYADVKAKERAYLLSRHTLKAAIPAAQRYVAGVKGVLTGFFHAASPKLTSFGLKPRKPAVRTAPSKAAAVVASAETRKIRGTLGRRQRLALRFTGEIAPAKVAAPAVNSTPPSTSAPTPPYAPPATPTEGPPK